MKSISETDYKYIKSIFPYKAQYLLEDEHVFLIYWMSFMKTPMIFYSHKQKSMVLINQWLRHSYDILNKNQKQNLREFVEKRYNIKINEIR